MVNYVRKENIIDTVTIEDDVDLNDPIVLANMPWRDYLRHQNYNKDPKKMCELCIKEQKAKYGGDTPIICDGLKDYETVLKTRYGKEVFEELVSELNELEIKELKQTFSPVEWFKAHMTDSEKAQDRWTQNLVLSCLDEDSPVAMSDGSYKKIKDIKVGDKVVSYNEVRRTLPINKVLNVWDRGYKESYKITLENGDSVVATDDHPFLGYFKTGKENKLFNCNSYKTSYLSIKDGLKVGDDLYTVNKSPVWGSFDNLEIAKLLGYICTDGYIDLKASKIQFRNIRKEYVDEFEKICLEQFQTKSTRKFKSSYCDLKTKVTRQDTWEVNIIKSKNLKDFLNSIGCIDKYSRETSIINFALDNFSEEACSVFINRVLSGDGCISKDKVQVSVSGKFKSEFLEKLSRLFRKVGVRRSKVYHSETVTGRRSALMVTESLSAKSLLSFTGPVFGKEFQCTEQLKIADANLQKWKTRRRVYNTTSRTKVISIEPVGKRHVYDIEVNKRHNFITNNIITHNCSAKNKALRQGRRSGKTYSIIIDLLFTVALAHKPINILVAAPQVTMIDEISQTLLQLAQDLDIPNFVVKKISQPILEIHFFNGSILKGITASNDGTSARGKKADIIWIDEVDFVPTKALDAIKAIQLDNPDVKMIYTSTPIGEGNLHTFANQKTTKEFHYPTFARPDYTDEMHSTTSGMSDIAYCQEILAIYGLDEAGVFQNRHIEAAYDNYISEFYNDTFVLNNRERFIILIGVDWNHDNNGTRVVVVAFDKILGKFFIVEKHRIAKIKMTQAISVETIIEVNRKFNADHIICDEGFGSAQVSQLRLKGEEQYGKVPPDHPDIKLVDTIAVQFASTLSIIDPVTHETIKKRTKQYLVEYTQKQLEDHNIALHDVIDNEVIMQMKNYHVAKTGLNGNIYKPKDKKIGDHDLDAFMLALYGFDMQYGEFIIPKTLEYGLVLPKDNSYNYDIASRTGNIELGHSLKINKRTNKTFGKRSFKTRSRW